MSDNLIDPKKTIDLKNTKASVPSTEKDLSQSKPTVASIKTTSASKTPDKPIVSSSPKMTRDSSQNSIKPQPIADNSSSPTPDLASKIEAGSSTQSLATDSVNKSLVTEKSIQAEIDEQQQKRQKEMERRKILWRKTRTVHDRTKNIFKFKLIEVKRITKVTKGGRRFRFFAAALAGDENGKVGVGFGKGNEVNSARIKAYAQAEKKMIKIPIVNGTIPHEVTGRFCSSHIFFKPAPEGTGIVIGGASRNVIALLGIKNIRGKSLGSNNKMNLIQATMKALQSLKTHSEWKALRFGNSNDD